jgi:hypothetical protein
LEPTSIFDPCLKSIQLKKQAMEGTATSRRKSLEVSEWRIVAREAFPS